MKILLILFVFMNFILSANANCHTGFACSIEPFESVTQKKYNLFCKNLDYYFSKEIDEDSFFLKKSSKIAYKDLFIFNKVV